MADLVEIFLGQCEKISGTCSHPTSGMADPENFRPHEMILYQRHQQTGQSMFNQEFGIPYKFAGLRKPRENHKHPNSTRDHHPVFERVSVAGT